MPADNIDKIVQEAEAAEKARLAGQAQPDPPKEAPPAKTVEENKEPPPKVKEAKEEPKPTEKPPAAKAKEKEPEDEDLDKDPLEDAEGMVKMPAKAFKTRIHRARKAELIAIFGHADREKILEWKKRSDERDAKDEENRRAKLAEEERLKEDLARANKATEEAKRALVEKEEQYAQEQYGRLIRGYAREHVDADYVDVAEGAFGRYVLSLSDQERDKMTETDVEKWFKDYVEKHPKIAKDAAPATKEPEVKKVPLTTGNPPKGGKEPQAPVAGTLGNKTAKLGQPNSMTDKEWAAYKKQQGISY